MSVISVCPAPGCDKEIHGDSTCCLKHWRALPKGLREKYADYDSYAGKIWMQKAQCVWRGVPKGLVSHTVIHNDLDRAIAAATEAAQLAKEKRGGRLTALLEDVNRRLYREERDSNESFAASYRSMTDDLTRCPSFRGLTGNSSMRPRIW